MAADNLQIAIRGVVAPYGAPRRVFALTSFRNHRLHRPPKSAIRILDLIDERMSESENPQSIGKVLTGLKLGTYWRYRVGDYRIICDFQDGQLCVLVIKIGKKSIGKSKNPIKCGEKPSDISDKALFHQLASYAVKLAGYGYPHNLKGSDSAICHEKWALYTYLDI